MSDLLTPDHLHALARAAQEEAARYKAASTPTGQVRYRTLLDLAELADALAVVFAHDRRKGA